MSWRLAKSLETLRAQINAAYPNRSKASDGTIGDAAHASRASDHNPNADGAVTAIDITHDPANGVDIQKIADALVASRDDRIKYIIANGKIVSGSGQKHPAWQWRTYTGSNKHTRHVHISVKGTKSAYDSVAQWAVAGTSGGKVTPSQSVLKRGSKGPFVTDLQRNMNTIGFGPIATDGVFGAKTEAAVKSFQSKSGIAVDGWAGPRTIEAIGMALAAMENAPKIAEAREEVKGVAVNEVEEKTSLWQRITGVFGAGSVGGSLLLGAQWQTVAVVAVAAIVIMVVILLLRRQIVGAVREIRDGLA